MSKGFEQLEVYQRAFRMMKPVYEFTAGLPVEEQRDLGRQMRRAAKSIPANIAEGFGRRSTPKEFCRYLQIAIGSANEMEAHIAIALELGQMREPDATSCDRNTRSSESN